MVAEMDLEEQGSIEQKWNRKRTNGDGMIEICLLPVTGEDMTPLTPSNYRFAAHLVVLERVEHPVAVNDEPPLRPRLARVRTHL